MIRWSAKVSKKSRMGALMLTLFLMCPLLIMVNVPIAMCSLPIHNIHTGLDYATIQEAIDASETLEGHTILADAGVYYENVVVWKDNLTIIGGSPATTAIDGDGVGEVVYVAADYVKIGNFTIQNGMNGVYLDAYTSNNTFVGNHIAANWEYGFNLDYSSDNVFIANNITLNWGGVLLWHSSDNWMYHNSFFDNTVHVDIEMSNNTWDDGYPNGGNYWSNYTGSDENGDGIGDTPHAIDADNQDDHPLMNPYAPDNAVMDATPSKTVVGQGFPLSLNVTVTNQGSKIEAFNVTGYANTSIIQTQRVTLSSGASATITLSWNTSSVTRGNYVVSAQAWPFPGEKDTADNLYTDGTVMVTIAGDVNGDGTVNVMDLTIVSLAFGNFKGEPDYNPEADLNEDGFVDMKDLSTVARHLGETDS